MSQRFETRAIQGLSFTTLAGQFGTPLYVYDANKIVEQINAMKNAFRGVPLRLKYACKALTNPAILSIMKSERVGIDTVSVGEIQMALLAGFSGSEIQFTPSGVHFEEIRQAAELGVRINLDSLQVLQQFGEAFGSTYPVSIRVNPSLLEGGNLKISTGHADSKFGIPYQQFEEVANLVAHYSLQVEGLHQHTGSDFKNAHIIIQAAERLYDLAFAYFPNLKFIDLGSGFKVAYSPDDHVTDMASLGKDVVSSFRQFQEKYRQDVELWFEPGKYLVSECGYLLVSATAIKHNPTKNFVTVDSGLNHLIRPMMYDAYHHITNVSAPENAPKETYDIVGYICETDTFGTDRHLPKVALGHILCFHNAGAYGFSMASNYNSRFRPAEVLIQGGQAHLIRRRETLEDLTATLVRFQFSSKGTPDTSLTLSAPE